MSVDPKSPVSSASSPRVLRAPVRPNLVTMTFGVALIVMGIVTLSAPDQPTLTMVVGFAMLVFGLLAGLVAATGLLQRTWFDPLTNTLHVRVFAEASASLAPPTTVLIRRVKQSSTFGPSKLRWQAVVRPDEGRPITLGERTVGFAPLVAELARAYATNPRLAGDRPTEKLLKRPARLDDPDSLGF